MATSGSIETKITNGYDFFGTNGWGKFDWTRSSYSSADNTSTVNWNIYLKLQWGIYPVGGGTSYSKVRVKINGESQDYVATYEQDGADNYFLLLSGSTTVAHSFDGTKTASVYVYISKYSYGNITAASDDDLSKTYDYPISGSMALDPIARPGYIIDVEEFTDEESPVLKYSNPSGDRVTKLEAAISLLDDAIVVPYREVSKTDGQYTFNFTDNELKALRKGVTTGGRTSVKFCLKTTIESEVFEDFASRRFTLVDYMPTLSPTMIDLNSKMIELTGDNQKLVRYYSNAQYNSNATARKEATIDSLSISYGDLTIEREADILTGVVENVINNSFEFKVIDSRGNVTRTTLTKTLIPYVKLSASLRVVEFALDGQLKFRVEGNYFNGSFGKVNNNLIIDYVIRKNGQQIEHKLIEQSANPNAFTFSNDSYVFEETVTGLSLEEADGSINDYTLVALVADKISLGVMTEEVTTSGTPIFDWSKSDFRFNVPVHFGRGFVSDIGLKTASMVRTIELPQFGTYDYCTLEELGISSDNTIYSINGTIKYNDNIYPLPSPALGISGGYNLSDATKVWISGETVKVTVSESWGAARVCIVVNYF